MDVPEAASQKIKVKVNIPKKDIKTDIKPPIKPAILPSLSLEPIPKISYSVSDTIPWVEKYRAKHMDEIVGHEHDLKLINNLIDHHALPHLLFYGPPGTGKTSMILCIARKLYGDTNYKKYILEINASSDRGIDTIREDVINFATTKTNNIKLIILDEFDAMTEIAQSALRGVIEKYSTNNRFCMLCNNINKVIPAIQSRCVKFRFSLLPSVALKDRLNHIIISEAIKITPEAIDTLICIEHDFRQMINILQGLHFTAIDEESPISSTDVLEYLGRPSVETIDKVYELLWLGKFEPVFSQLLDLIKTNAWHLLDMLSFLLHRILKDKVIPINRKNFIIERLSEIEFRVINGRETEIQLANLVASFNVALTL